MPIEIIKVYTMPRKLLSKWFSMTEEMCALLKKKKVCDNNDKSQRFLKQFQRARLKKIIYLKTR